MSEHDHFAKVARLLEQGRAFGSARILSVRGSVPQRPGASMVVLADGRSEGTVGGGLFEAGVIEDLRALIGGGRHLEVRSYRLTEGGVGMRCEGEADVLLEVFAPADELVIFGGGHVGQALSRLAAVVGGFRVTVLDDREAFADAALHPGAAVVRTDPGYVEGLPTLGPHTYVVLVTRGHDLDQVLCGRLAGLDLAYLGMIASKAKAKAILRDLEKTGIAQEHLERVHTPIGLDLGRTKAPGEVALSILAEVVKVRSARAPGPARA